MQRQYDAQQALLNARQMKADLGITRIADITALDNLAIPVKVAIRPNSKHLANAQGKALSESEAEIAAIMEAAESFAMEAPINADALGSYDELKNQFDVIEPERWPLKKLFRADGLNSKSCQWVKATHLLENKFYYLPAVLSHIDSTQTDWLNHFFAVSSNGLAAGFVTSEVQYHSLTELVERHCFAHWQQLSLDEKSTRRIDLDQIDCDKSAALIKRITAANMNLAAWDMTDELGISAVHCAMFEENKYRSLGVATGSGASLCPFDALQRAISEAAQSRLALINGSRDDIFPGHYQRLAEASLLEVMPLMAQKPRTVLAASKAFSNYQSALDELLQRLSAAGHRDIYYYHYPVDIANLQVGQAFIPSLQGVLA